MAATILDSIIAYFAALGLFAVLWTVYGWILGYWRWLIGKRNRND